MYNSLIQTAVGLVPKELLQKLLDWRIIDPNNYECFLSWIDPITNIRVATAYSYLQQSNTIDRILADWSTEYQVSETNLWDLILFGNTKLNHLKADLPQKAIYYTFNTPSISELGAREKKSRGKF